MAQSATKKIDDFEMDAGGTALTLIPDNLDAVELYKSGLEPLLAKIRTVALAEIPDLSTVSGRKRIAARAYQIARSKTLLDDMGDAQIEEARKTVTSVNAKRKHMRDTLDALKEEVRKPLTDWENEDKTRMDAHERELAAIEAAGSNAAAMWATLPLETMRGQLDLIRGDKRDYEEFTARHQIVKDNAIKALQSAVDRRETYEKEQAELKQLRDAEEARVKKEREDKIAAEAAAEAKRVAEEKAAADAKAAAEKAEAERQRVADEAAAAQRALEEQASQARAREEQAIKDKADAEQKVKDAESRRVREAEEAETRRIEAAKQAEEKAAQVAKDAEARVTREREEAAAEERRKAQKKADDEAEAARKREADKKHHAKINGEALDAIATVMASVKALDDGREIAKAIVTAIAKGEVPNVTISY